MEKPDEIEITPEMIEAGIKAFWAYEDREGGDAGHVESIFRAMQLARQPPDLGLLPIYGSKLEEK